jgi:imidazolonepropionase-like amidohydrolase
MNEYLLQNCSVLDYSSNNWEKEKSIHIKNGIIKNILEREEKGKNLKKIDLEQSWIIPGLIDAHVHICHEGDQDLAVQFRPDEPLISSIFRAAKNLNTALQTGVTLVKDVGSYQRRGIKIKKAIKMNFFHVPTVISCGNLLTTPRGHVFNLGKEVKGIENCKKAVRNEIIHGADFIKVTNDPIGFSPEELSAIVEETHRLGKIVSCHSYTEESIQMALDAKADTIEHGSPFNREMILQIKKQGTIIVPTLYCAIKSVDIEKSLINENDLPLFQRWLSDLMKNIPIAIKNEINIAAGTDAGFPPIQFFSIVDEIISYVKVGASPLTAIKYATFNSARACAMENQNGNISIGKNANLLVLKKNPLDNIENLRSIKMVIKDGKIV